MTYCNCSANTPRGHQSPEEHAVSNLPLQSRVEFLVPHMGETGALKSEISVQCRYQRLATYIEPGEVHNMRLSGSRQDLRGDVRQSDEQMTSTRRRRVQVVGQG